MFMLISDLKPWYLFDFFTIVYFLKGQVLRMSSLASLAIQSATIFTGEFPNSNVSRSSTVNSLHLLVPSCGFSMHLTNLWTVTIFLFAKACLCLPDACSFSHSHVNLRIWEQGHSWIVLMFCSYWVTPLFDDR